MTTQLNGLLKTPTQQHLTKLFKASIGFTTNSHIQREENKKYQSFHIDKKSSRRLLSKGRVLSQEDVDRLKSEDLQKQEASAWKLTEKEYEEGTTLLELDVTTSSRAVLNPGEYNQDWAHLSYIFRCDPQPANEWINGSLIWKGTSQECGSRPCSWSARGSISPPKRR